MKRMRFFSILFLAVTFLFSGVGFVHAQPSKDLGKYYVMVTPDNYYKFRGDTVKFTGSHFYPGEAVLVIKDGVRIDTVKADSNGYFVTQPYQVPQSDDKEIYTFFGTTSLLYYSTQITISGGNAWLTLSNYYAPAGSLVTIYGNNFSKNENVRVWFDGVYQGLATTNAKGNFMMTIRIPNSGEGKQLIQAIGVKSGIKATQTFSQAR